MVLIEVPVEPATVNYTACGKQHDSMKESRPNWTMPRSTRDDAKKVHLSNKMKQDLLGRDSPGFNYEPKRQKELPKWGFGTSASRPCFAQQYPPSSNDLLGRTPDPGKYRAHGGKPLIGTCPRDAPSNAPDLCSFPPGTISPGPQRYNTSACPLQRLGHAPNVDKNPPKYTIGVRTEAKDLIQSTGEKVGPGVYPIPAACGKQYESTKPSKPGWSMSNQDRFKEKRQHDNYRLWDGEGKKKEQFNRKFSQQPSFSFGTSSRTHAAKLAPALSAADRGPAAKMPHMSQSTPNLAPRREILKYSDLNCM